MNKRDTLFDSIKGIAILGIMFIHLGQWNLNLPEGSRLAIIRSSGLLGVELTYLVNAFFLSKHYCEHGFENVGGYILKSILSIVPVYWFGLIIYWISVSFSEDGCTASALNIISHFLFFNGLTPTWWAGFMGGTGYFGVLVIMWVLYPLYLKRIKGTREAVEFAIVTISCSYILMEFVKWINSKILIDASGNMNDWIWYIFRGIYCYSIGCVLYFLAKNDNKTRKNMLLIKISEYALLMFVLVKALAQGSSFDGILFVILWCGLIVLARKERLVLIDNRVFAFLGRNITELFVLHIVLYYVLVQNQGIIRSGWKTMILLSALSVIIAPILKVCISKTFGKLNKKLLRLISMSYE